jgi:hypothetical protein
MALRFPGDSLEGASGFLISYHIFLCDKIVPSHRRHMPEIEKTRCDPAYEQPSAESRGRLFIFNAICRARKANL